jgi:hypothetical protein
LVLVMVSAVGAACWAAISLRATSMVGSTALEYYRKVPAMARTRVFSFLSSRGAVLGVGANWTLAPYVGVVHGWGEYCGRVGVLWLNL